jgi:hypothetical protein
LLSISEKRRGTIKNTFVRLNPECPSTQNHNTVKSLFPPPIRLAPDIHVMSRSFSIIGIKK